MLYFSEFKSANEGFPFKYYTFISK